MKVGIDVHGVLDTNLAFCELSRVLVEAGHEVHIMTGSPRTGKLMAQLTFVGAKWTHFFSITDHCEELGIKVTYDEIGNPWVDNLEWNRAKGDYAEKVGLDLMIDDSEEYKGHFPKHIPYLLVG